MKVPGWEDRIAMRGRASLPCRHWNLDEKTQDGMPKATSALCKEGSFRQIIPEGEARFLEKGEPGKQKAPRLPGAPLYLVHSAP